MNDAFPIPFGNNVIGEAGSYSKVQRWASRRSISGRFPADDINRHTPCASFIAVLALGNVELYNPRLRIASRMPEGDSAWNLYCSSISFIRLYVAYLFIIS